MLKVVENKKGRLMYFNNNKLISQDEYDRLKGVEGIDAVSSPVATAEPAAGQLPQRICIFCGEAANRTKYLDQQTIWICEDDYFSHTTGEIVAQTKLRKSEL